MEETKEADIISELIPYLNMLSVMGGIAIVFTIIKTLVSIFI